MLRKSISKRQTKSRTSFGYEKRGSKPTSPLMKILWIGLVVVIIFSVIVLVSSLFLSKQTDLNKNTIIQDNNGNELESNINNNIINNEEDDTIIKEIPPIKTEFKVKYRIYNNDYCDDSKTDEYIEITMVF